MDRHIFKGHPSHQLDRIESAGLLERAMPSCRCNGMNPDCCFCGGTGAIRGSPLKNPVVPESSYCDIEQMVRSAERRRPVRVKARKTRAIPVDARHASAWPAIPQPQTTPIKKRKKRRKGEGPKIKKGKGLFRTKLSGEGTFPSF